jgi:hypothetical protein
VFENRVVILANVSGAVPTQRDVKNEDCSGLVIENKGGKKVLRITR